VDRLFCGNLEAECGEDHRGGINAVSGLPDADESLGEPQNYLVCPDQPWLDGCNIGDGVIRQFVAMPLGQGYSMHAPIRMALSTRDNRPYGRTRSGSQREDVVGRRMTFDSTACLVWALAPPRVSRAASTSSLWIPCRGASRRLSGALPATVVASGEPLRWER
jgi:hypothetical protein